MADPSLDPALWEHRGDGTAKGQGFLGLLRRPDGGVSSELSIGVNMGGQEVEIPAIVPTLSADEVRHLLNTPANQPIPPSIVQKAVDFARQRHVAGRAYFAQPGEQNTALYPEFERASMLPPGASLLSPSHGATPPQGDNLSLALQMLLNRK